MELMLKGIATSALINKTGLFGEAYTSCTELPLYNFIKIVVSGEIKWLIKHGHVFGLKSIWVKVFEEYQNLNGDDKQKHHISLIRQINFLRNKLFFVQMCAGLLQKGRNEEVVKILRGHGYHNIERPELILSQSKFIAFQIRELEAELQNAQASTEKETPLTEAGFDQNLVLLSKHFGYKIDSKTESVSSYCALLKQLKEDISNATKRADKRTHK